MDLVSLDWLASIANDLLAADGSLVESGGSAARSGQEFATSSAFLRERLKERQDPFTAPADEKRDYHAAGVRILGREGEEVGAIGVFRAASKAPWNHREAAALAPLARLAGSVFEVRRSEAEWALARGNSDLLASALDCTEDAVLITEGRPIDEPGPRIVYANAAFQKMTGYSLDELIGRTPRMLQGPDTDRRELDRIHAAITAWRPVRVELTNYRKDGTPFQVEIDIAPMNRAGDSHTHLVSIQRDVTDWRRAQEEHASFFKMARDPFVIGGRDGRFRRVNAAFERTLGWTEEELVSKPFFEFVHPDDMDVTLAAFKRPSSDFAAQRFENRYRCKNGEYRTLSWTGENSADGTAFFAVARDVTAERQSENRVRLLLESTTDCVFALDRQERFVYLNQRAIDRISGGRDLLGMKIEEAFPEGVGTLFQESFRKAMATQRPASMEEYYAPLEGWFEVHCAPSPELLTVYFRDVTRQREASELLRRSERRLVEAQRIARIANWRYDIRTGLADWSPAMYELLETPPDEFPPSFDSFLRFVHPEDRERMTEVRRRMLAGQEAMDLQVRVILGGGAERYYDVRGKLDLDANGEPAEVFGTIQDVTEQRLAAVALIESEARLQQAQKLEAIGSLAGGIAHDFNNVLTVINGYASLLLDRLDAGDASRGPLQYILDSGRRAAALTQQLLAFSRRQVFQPRSVDLNEVVRRMEPMLRRLIPENIHLALSAKEGLWRTEADATQIEQVILNLVVNARDAIERDGAIAIDLDNVDLSESYAAAHPEVQAGSYALLSVSDTGAGMGEETRRRAFEPFFTTKGREKGTGLGLSTVYGIVKQSSGHVSIYSEPGMGATVKVYLPKAENQESEEGAMRPELTSLDGSETVLVVEDDEKIRQFAVEVLASHGYRVLAAANGEEALVVNRTVREQIHLLLTDMVMPAMGGRELADGILKQRPRMAVLYMSGYTENSIVHQGVLDPDVEFLPKPFTAEDLARKVRTVLNEAAPVSVLVVDDEEGVRDMLSEALSQAGFRVLTAPNGEPVPELCRTEDIRLVITDLVMPEREGLETIQALRREFPRIKILAISGRFIGTALKAAQMLGADGTIAKPFEPSAVVEAARRLLRRTG